ncbi:MAG: archaellin/type IV pilin N-terminal domain-containing protein [Candidatus Bathyarchaeia archaeon]
MRKFRKNVRAISPVLSVLMMIAVAVAASLVTYAWVMGYLGFTTAKVGKAIQIQSIAKQGNDLVVYVQNVGDGAVKLLNGASLYVDGVLTNANPSKNELLKGETANYAVSDYFTGKTLPLTVKVKVVTEDGTFTEASQLFG